LAVGPANNLPQDSPSLRNEEFAHQNRFGATFVVGTGNPLWNIEHFTPRAWRSQMCEFYHSYHRRISQDRYPEPPLHKLSPISSSKLRDKFRSFHRICYGNSLPIIWCVYIKAPFQQFQHPHLLLFDSLPGLAPGMSFSLRFDLTMGTLVLRPAVEQKQKFLIENACDRISSKGRVGYGENPRRSQIVALSGRPLPQLSGTTK